MYNDPIGHTIVPTNRKNKWQLEIDIKYQLKFTRQLYSVMFMERCTSKVTGIKIYQQPCWYRYCQIRSNLYQQLNKTGLLIEGEGR